MADIINIDELKQHLQEFARQRDWEKFHNAKNLAMALVCEAGELVEIFQWLDTEQAEAASTDPALVAKTAEELADIMICAIRLADIMQLPINRIIEEKIAINNQKYPVELVKGSAKKYTEYQ
jgi:NTP pyrophosphatase (non-canonical NTP hydrolase)